MPRLKRALLFVHRWLGTTLCLCFLVWFPSGIAMMYWGYPEVTERDRLAHGIDLTPAAIRISPAEALAASGLSDAFRDVRLGTHDGRPAYRFVDADGETIVYADTGDVFNGLAPEGMLRVAAAWAARPAEAARPERLQDVDQWTLQVGLADLAPVWKYEWSDGYQVYVSAATGEVIQQTSRGQRIGAYLGPVLHWFYFTPLRRHGPVWSRVVIWTSSLGAGTALLGISIGLWMYLPRRRLIYAGQKRWHMLLGLLFGVAAVTWAFSGLLSMDPFPALSGTGARRSAAAEAVPRALRLRASISGLAEKPPQEALAELAELRVRELRFAELGGRPFYLARLADGDTRIVPVDGPPHPELNRERLIELVADAAASDGGATVRTLGRYDTYYTDRNGALPLPVLVAELRDRQRTRYYIDPRTAQVVGRYSDSGWANRWLYHGLHSLQFPGLYTSRPLWDVVMVACMLGGSALSFTSVVLAWRVVRGRRART